MPYNSIFIRMTGKKTLLNFLIFFVILCPVSAFAQKSKIMTAPAVPQVKPPYNLKYEVSFSKPHTHLYEVTYTVGNINAATIDLQIPTWTPGSYLQREFAKNIQDFAVRDASNNNLNWEKIDKATWRVTTNDAKEIKASYRVYAYELSVRTSHLDSSHAYFNGASVFMYVKGAVEQPLKLKINAPNSWRVTTPLALNPDADGYFSAPNYDVLVDSPAEIGTHNVIEFDVLGKRHRIAIWGEANYDAETLKRDFTKIIEQGAAIFGGSLPYEHYTFIIHLQPGIGGGLEHLNSTTCQSSPNVFKAAARYQQFLGLISHEYFHLWNVKRIRPKALGPFDYQAENYTKNLWVSEGITSYYGDQLLLRAGLQKSGMYVGGIGAQLQRYDMTPGRLLQSAEAGSFDAWIKYYRPDENSPNTAMSYYDKGEILGMLFDLETRKATNNSKSLDDVMRLLYENHALPKPGFSDAELKAAFEKIAGTDFTDFYAKYVSGTVDIDWNRFLGHAGLQLTKGYSNDVQGQETPPRGFIGVRLKPGGTGIANVYADTPAYNDGLNVNDEIIAVNGQRVDNAGFIEFIAALPIGKPATFAVFRREKLISLPVTIARQPPDRYVITAMKEADASQLAIRRSWLAEK
jgi:predicted metalloprotease with PDZ domain